MKVLVLGGTGLLGKNLENYVYKFCARNEWVFTGSKDADLRNLEETQKLFELHNPTHVINLAAYVGGLFKNMNENVEFFENNMMITLNVMKCCRNVEKLISIMSTCIFPDKISYPITEDKLHMGPPHPSNEGYSYAKRMIDVLSRLYNNEYGTNYITIIPGNLYGPHDNFNLEDGHVIPSLIHKCFLANENGTNFTVYGTGNPLRQFTYAEDLAKYIVWALDNYNSNEPLILSTAEENSISYVAQCIAKCINYKGQIVYDIEKSDGQFKKTIDNRKLTELCGDPQFVSLNRGIQLTVNWFLEHYPYVRK